MTYYDTEQWATETADGRRLYNAGFRMLSDDIEGWELLKTVPMDASAGEAEGELVYMWQRTGGQELLWIGIAELPDWATAQQRLLADLEMSMRPDIPRATGELGQLGDIAYVARDPETDIPSSVTFVRGNVYVSVRSVGDRVADASPPAIRLDRTLGLPPDPKERGSRRRQGRSIEAPAPTAGEERAILDDIEAVASGGWLQAFAADGELRRRGSSLVLVGSSERKTGVEIFIRRPPSGKGRSKD